MIGARRVVLASVGGLPLLAGLATGCAMESWRNADHQVDISGAGLDDESVVRLCVPGAGMVEQAVGDGTVGFTGLQPEARISLTVDALDGDDHRLGRVGPLEVTERYAKADWAVCDPATDPCAACQTPGQPAPAGGPDVLLAVRFVDSGS